MLVFECARLGDPETEDGIGGQTGHFLLHCARFVTRR